MCSSALVGWSYSAGSKIEGMFVAVERTRCSLAALPVPKTPVWIWGYTEKDLDRVEATALGKFTRLMSCCYTRNQVLGKRPCLLPRQAAASQNR